MKVQDKRLTRNAARCKTCGTLLESRHRHHSVACPCGNAVDGGLEYVRRAGNPEDLEELSEYETYEREEYLFERKRRLDAGADTPRLGDPASIWASLDRELADMRVKPNINNGGFPKMESKDISSESWREYDFGGRVYRIENPRRLYVGTTTHRVVDANGVTHCAPAPGFSGCVLRWMASPEVSF